MLSNAAVTLLSNSHFTPGCVWSITVCICLAFFVRIACAMRIIITGGHSAPHVLPLLRIGSSENQVIRKVQHAAQFGNAEFTLFGRVNDGGDGIITATLRYRVPR